ncbi:MAG: hypothetical protein EXR69_06105 [Myxococcales bacterium]|nr:hypothetical protein [Myxococcales bacterium]
MLLAFAATFPAWLDPAHRFVGRAEGEIRDHAWVAWLVQHRVWTDHAVPLHFPNVGFPRGISLYPLDPLNQLVLTLLTPLVGLSPALLVLTTALLALTGIAAGRLSLALGQSGTRAAAVAALTVLGPPVLGSFVDGQTEGMGTCWALFALATFAGGFGAGGGGYGWRGLPGVRRALRLGLEGSALIASAPYQAHAWCLAGGLLLLGLVALRRFPPMSLLSLILIVPVGLLCARGLHSAESGRDGQITQRTRQGDWPPRTMMLDAIMPPAQPQVGVTPTPAWPWPRELRLLVPTTGPRRWSGFGLPALTIGAVGLAILGLRRSQGAPSRAKGARRHAATVFTLAGGAAIFASIAWGSARDHGLTFPLPFDLWYRHFPLGHLAWKPQQYAVPAWELAVVAAGFLPTPALVLGALFVGLEVQLSSPVQLPLPALELRPQAWMHEVSGPVIEFPARARSRGGVGRLPEDELLAQTVHGQPIADPFGRGGNPIQTVLLDALGREAGWGVAPETPRVPQALGVAVRAGFKVLVVHAGGMSESERKGVLAAMTAANGPPSEADGVWLWRLGEPDE